MSADANLPTLVTFVNGSTLRVVESREAVLRLWRVGLTDVKQRVMMLDSTAGHGVWMDAESILMIEAVPDPRDVEDQRRRAIPGLGNVGDPPAPVVSGGRELEKAYPGWVDGGDGKAVLCTIEGCAKHTGLPPLLRELRPPAGWAKNLHAGDGKGIERYWPQDPYDTRRSERIGEFERGQD